MRYTVLSRAALGYTIFHGTDRPLSILDDMVLGLARPVLCLPDLSARAKVGAVVALLRELSSAFGALLPRSLVLIGHGVEPLSCFVVFLLLSYRVVFGDFLCYCFLSVSCLF